MHRAGRPQMDHGLSLLLFLWLCLVYLTTSCCSSGVFNIPHVFCLKTPAKAEGQAEIWALRWEGRCSLLIQLMTDEVLVEEFRQHFGRVLKHVRGCAQANEASKANQMGNFPDFSLFPPCWPGEAVSLRVAIYFEAWPVVSVKDPHLLQTLMGVVSVWLHIHASVEAPSGLRCLPLLIVWGKGSFQDISLPGLML